jgi:hypothetical protein
MIQRGCMCSSGHAVSWKHPFIAAVLQEASILRTNGYEVAQRDEFLKEVGLSLEDWAEWVEYEVLQAVRRLGTVATDGRSPREVIEDLIEVQRKVQPVFGPCNDLRKLVEQHPTGPLSDYYMLPAFLQVCACSCIGPSLLHRLLMHRPKCLP